MEKENLWKVDATVKVCSICQKKTEEIYTLSTKENKYFCGKCYEKELEKDLGSRLYYYLHLFSSKN